MNTAAPSEAGASADFETDYLVIGSGAMGLAFADELLAHSQAHITFIDRHGRPGGHWNDAYPFVALHQPSAFYGVNSLELGSGRKDEIGLNQGLLELATGAELLAYFERVMKERLLPSGRVRYFPMSDHLGDGEFVNLLSGQRRRAKVRKRIVDATFFGTSVPSTHKPKYGVAAGARLVTPNALPGLWQGLHRGEALPSHFAVIGAGKTAMDAVVWLLQNGAPADAIHWVVPRDSWLLNRARLQPSAEFFEATVGGQADLYGAFAQAQDVRDLFHRLEAAGVMLRVDPQHEPRMFHYATISEAEVALLRQVRQVVRMGHVAEVQPDALQLQGGNLPLPPHTLCIDCSASAVSRRPPQPIFQPGRMVLQWMRVPAPTFSAALAAQVELRDIDDGAKNRLCPPLPQDMDQLQGYVRLTLGNMMNQQIWRTDESLRRWIRESRLDGFTHLIASADPANAAQQALLARLKANIIGAMANMARLLEPAAA